MPVQESDAVPDAHTGARWRSIPTVLSTTAANLCNNSVELLHCSSFAASGARADTGCSSSPDTYGSQWSISGSIRVINSINIRDLQLGVDLSDGSLQHQRVQGEGR